MDLIRAGRSIRALRVRRGWRQADLADAAQLSRSIVGRVERGEQTGLTIDAIDRVATALGAQTDLALRWQGEGIDRLLDEAHARLVEVVVALLGEAGWEVAVEVSFSRQGERGSVDVLGYHRARRALVVVEVKSVVPDLQATLAGLDRKGRLAPSLARERGWEAGRVGRVLVAWDTRTNRRRLGSHARTVAAALSGGTWDVRHWLADPAGDGFGGVWFVPAVRGLDATGVWRRRVRRSPRARARPVHPQRTVSGMRPPDGP